MSQWVSGPPGLALVTRFYEAGHPDTQVRECGTSWYRIRGDLSVDRGATGLRS